MIDIQREFVDPSLGSDIASAQKAYCLDGARRLLAYAREEQWKVIHVGTQHEREDSLPIHLRLSGATVYCEAQGEGKEFWLTPREGEIILFKRNFSSFFDTELSEHVKDVDVVVFSGVSTDCCIFTSVFDSQALNKKNIVPLQAVSATSVDAFAPFLESISKSAGHVVDLEDLLRSGISGCTAMSPHDVREKSEAWFYEKGS